MNNSVIITDTAIIRRNFDKFIQEKKDNPSIVNGMMDATYSSVNLEELSATLIYEVKPWEANRIGILHGGIICTMLDHTAGVTAASFIGGWCPTVDMDVRFLKSVQIGTIIEATGKILSAGSRIIFVHSELKEKDTGRLLAVSSSTFANNVSAALSRSSGR